MTRLRIILLLITIVSLAAGYSISPEMKVDEKPYLKEVAPDTVFSGKGGDPPHYLSKSGTAAFNSFDVVPSIRGYAGPIKVLLAIDSGGTITGLKILEHKETKNYVHYMVSPDYLRQFLGKNVKDPIMIDTDIDAISRATESVKALAKTVRVSSREIASRVYGLEVRSDERGEQSVTGWVIYLMLFLSAFTFYYITRRSRELLRTRDFSLVLGIFIIGFYLAAPFSILNVFNFILFRHSSSIIWYVIIFSTLLSVVLAGRFYCGWLCPFGALAEFIGRMPFRKWELSVTTDDTWRRVKYLLLCLIAMVVFVSRQSEYGNYETYVALFAFHGNTLMWLLVALMLVINVRVKRFWCRYLCPVAALTGMLSRKAGGYVSTKDCPMGNRQNPLISECIRCNRCYRKEQMP